jgi:hypothetical protein
VLDGVAFLPSLCAADWTIKLWDDSHTAGPVMSWDIGMPIGASCGGGGGYSELSVTMRGPRGCCTPCLRSVGEGLSVPFRSLAAAAATAAGDIAWAPFSATCFGAVTDAGKVQVWDLDRDPHAPLCDQKVVKKARGTRLAFNAAAPVLLAADSAGGVVSFKLSPNLRRVTPIPQPPLKKVRHEALAGGVGRGSSPCVRPTGTGRALPALTLSPLLLYIIFYLLPQGEVPPPAPSRAEVEIRKLDALLALTDAKIAIVTPIPGQASSDPAAAAGGKKGGAEAGGAEADAGAE